MTETSPIIVWIRRDLRLTDHPALSQAAASGRPVIPVFLLDEVLGATGAAFRARLGLGLGSFADSLATCGSRLVLRRGPALDVLQALIAETGAGAVWWQRAYDPAAQARDTAVKSALKGQGVDARSFPGHLLFEPWTVATKTGDCYKVYTPFWRSVKDREVPAPLPAIATLTPPMTWPHSDALAAWAMAADLRRGAPILAAHQSVGEAAAAARLAQFLGNGIDGYAARRDLPGEDGTSRLSAPLTYGEISPRVLWHAGLRALHEGKSGAETWLKELVWREFAYHLLHHTPRLATGNWREGWDAFPWNEDDTRPEVLAWKQGRTGVPFVDAAMREMYVTGTMHNRARMIVASYLTKHLLTHWNIGLRWFEACLTDWDPASNALGWQWAAGSGPDAAPYFRVFNPETQAEKFDKDGRYRNRWIAEGRAQPSDTALSYFDAVPLGWGLSPEAAYPAPVVSLPEGRDRALAAYKSRSF